MEKLIHNQLSKHLEEISYLSENQHGFRKNHSTIHSIAQLTNYINVNMDKKLTTIVTFIDFRKAFDCVQHETLLGKLSAINLDSKVISWFRSYLSDRRQRVLANDVHSSYLDVTQGVPQGSVLGPLFYIIYANDIVKMIKHCNIAMYADDTVLYLAKKNFEKAIDGMQKDVSALESWCLLNGIQMNVDKTSLSVFNSAQRLGKLPEFDILAQNKPLKKVTSYKHLGVILDNQLNYNKQIQKIISTVTDKLKQFRRMRYFLNTKAAKLVYKNMILPIIEYGDIFLVGATLLNRKKLQVLQNKGLRCALNRGIETSVAELHRIGKVAKLKQRRNQHLLSYMYDMSQITNNLKKKREGGVQTRSQNKRLVKIRKPSTEKFKKSLAYVGPKKWNDLPEELHHIRSRHSFNSKIQHCF